MNIQLLLKCKPTREISCSAERRYLRHVFLCRRVAKQETLLKQKCKMRCISCSPPSIPSMVTNGKAKSKQCFNSVESFQPYKISKACWLLQWQNRGYGSLTTRATAPTSVFLAATSPPNSGDFSVLFQTSAVMLLMYVIANFVVPEFILKGFQTDEANKDAEEEDQLNELGRTPRRTASSGKRNKGFGRRE